MTAAKILIDTNVLIYARDRREPKKQARAIELLDELARNRLGALSAQTLGEYFRVVTRKLPERYSAEEALLQVEQLLEIWPVYEVTPQVVLEAARGVVEHLFSYWDSQIWATAKLNQIGIVLSEDFDSGGIIEGVRFVNPFV